MSKSYSRYWGPFRQEWYSICSAHQYGSPYSDCDLCKCGRWVPVVDHMISQYFHNNHYKLWYWYVNHDIFGYQMRRRLKKWFPNLK